MAACARSRTAARTWGDLHDRTLHVVATKTGRAARRRPARAARAGPRRVADGLRPPRLTSELIVPRPSGGQWTREDWANWRRRVWRPAAIEAGRHRRPAAVPPPRLVRLAAALGGPQPDLRRRAGRALGRDPRPALRRGDQRAGKQAPRARRRGHPPGPRGGLRDALRTHPQILDGPNQPNPLQLPVVGDAGLEPATSALSRRRSPS